MVTVKVLQLNIWRNKKGYFFKALGKDHFAYGVPAFKVGSIIEFDEGQEKINNATHALNVRQPASTNKEGERITRLEPTNPAPKDSRQDYYIKKEAADLAREPVITMLSCISSACHMYDGSHSTKEVIETAEAFFQVAMKKKGASP